MAIRCFNLFLLFVSTLTLSAQNWWLIQESESNASYYIKTDSWPEDLCITPYYQIGDTLFLQQASSSCQSNTTTTILFVHGIDSIHAYRTLNYDFKGHIPIVESYNALPIALGRLWLSIYECEFANHCGGSTLSTRFECFKLKDMYSGVLDSSCGYTELINNFFPEPRPVAAKQKRRV